MPQLPKEVECLYAAQSAGGVSLVTRREGAEAILRALTEADSAPADTPGGRGALSRFSWLPGRDGLVRPCRRGGVMRFLGRNYVLENRPLREFEAHCEAVARGIPAPTPLGIAWQRTGGFLRGALATEAVNAPDLLAWLRLPENANPSAQATTLRRCGALVRKMHDAGVWHADLQVKNLLVSPEGPMLIDFDGARVGAPPGNVNRARNLLRFRRSLERRGLEPGLFDAFLEGYGPAVIPGWLNLAYRLRGAGRKGVSE